MTAVPLSCGIVIYRATVFASVLAVSLLFVGCGDDENKVGTTGVEQSSSGEGYATKVTITIDRGPPNVFLHGTVGSAESGCEVGRDVSVHRRVPGPDPLLRTFRSEPGGAKGTWGSYLRQVRAGWRLYAVVDDARLDEFTCLRHRSEIHHVRG